MSTDTEPTKLELVVLSKGVEGESALAIKTAMQPFFAQAMEWQAKVATVTDPKVARASRLVLKKIRVEAGHKKDELKESALTVTRAIDAAWNLITEVISPMEETLDAVEKAAQRAEEQRIAKIKADREALLAPYGVNTVFFDLAAMPSEVFADLLADKKAGHEAKIEALRKQEADRIAREKSEAEERERVRIENERLKREAAEREEASRIEREKAEIERKRLEAERRKAEDDARKHAEFLEAKAAEERRNAEAASRIALEKATKEREEIEARAKQEREKAEAIARKERLAREKLEAEKREAQAVEARRIKEENAALEKAKRAPDKEKIKDIANRLRCIFIQECSTSEGKELLARVIDQINQLAAEIDNKANAL